MRIPGRLTCVDSSSSITLFTRMHKLSFIFLATILAACPLRAIEVFGYAEPNRVSEMVFAENGVLSEIFVEEGQFIQKGDVLARLNSETLEAERAIAVQQAGFQELRFEQYQRLRENNNASLEEYERAKSDLEIARLQVTRIEAQIRDRSLIAPFNGIVERIHLELSEGATAQSKVLTLVDLAKLQVSLNVPIAQVNNLEVSKTVKLEMHNYGAIEGTVVFISPTYDAASQTVRVQVTIPNPEGQLRSGLKTSLQ